MASINACPLVSTGKSRSLFRVSDTIAGVQLAAAASGDLSDVDREVWTGIREILDPNNFKYEM